MSYQVLISLGLSAVLLTSCTRNPASNLEKTIVALPTAEAPIALVTTSPAAAPDSPPTAEPSPTYTPFQIFRNNFVNDERFTEAISHLNLTPHELEELVETAFALWGDEELLSKDRVSITILPGIPGSPDPLISGNNIAFQVTQGDATYPAGTLILRGRDLSLGPNASPEDVLTEQLFLIPGVAPLPGQQTPWQKGVVDELGFAAWHVLGQNGELIQYVRPHPNLMASLQSGGIEAVSESTPEGKFVGYFEPGKDTLLPPLPPGVEDPSFSRDEETGRTTFTSVNGTTYLLSESGDKWEAIEIPAMQEITTSAGVYTILERLPEGVPNNFISFAEDSESDTALNRLLYSIFAADIETSDPEVIKQWFQDHPLLDKLLLAQKDNTSDDHRMVTVLEATNVDTARVIINIHVGEEPGIKSRMITVANHTQAGGYFFELRPAENGTTTLVLNLVLQDMATYSVSDLVTEGSGFCENERLGAFVQDKFEAVALESAVDRFIYDAREGTSNVNQLPGRIPVLLAWATDFISQFINSKIFTPKNCLPGQG